MARIAAKTIPYCTKLPKQPFPLSVVFAWMISHAFQGKIKYKSFRTRNHNHNSHSHSQSQFTYIITILSKNVRSLRLRFSGMRRKTKIVFRKRLVKNFQNIEAVMSVATVISTYGNKKFIPILAWKVATTMVQIRILL